jgi:hypothetical protein
MQNFRFAAAIAALLTVAVPAVAADLQPIQNQSIDLGDVAGDAYYTVEPDGYRVVATFAQRGQSGTPVRFQALLAPGQSVTFSTPGAVGTAPSAVEIIRQQDRVLVHKASS